MSGLVGYWPLNEWSGRANDLSGNDNHGALEGTIEQGHAAPGALTGYRIDAAADAIRCGNSADFDITDNLTMACWFKPTASASGNRRIMQKDIDTTTFSLTPYSLGFRTTDTHWGPWGLITDGTDNENIGFTDQSAPIGEWAHIAFVVEDSRLVLYLDGEELGYTTRSLSIGTDTGDFGIAETVNAWDGVVADARLYNRALSAEEVSHIYQLGAVNTATPPDERDANALSRWAFDDRSDPTTAIDSWSTNDGTVNNSTYTDRSIDGLAAEFNGTDAYIEAPSLGLDSSTPFSISAWVYRDAGGTAHSFLSKGTSSGHYQFYVQGAGPADTFEFFVGSSTNGIQPNTTTTIPAGTWKHCVGTYDPSGPTAEVYINGVKEDEETGAVDEFGGTESTIIGARYDLSQFHDGELDDVRVYDKVLTRKEIEELYQWGTGGVNLNARTVTR